MTLLKTFLLIDILLFLYLIFILAWPEKTVRLEPKNFLMKAAYIRCLDSNKERKDKGVCVRALAKDAVENLSIPQIEASLSTITDSQQLQWCHEFMHYAGWEVYRKSNSIADAFLKASGKCDSGMYHGITEEYINQAEMGYDKEVFLERIVPQACEDEFPRQNLPVPMKNHCYHGLGHAFMFIAENDLRTALRYCEAVGKQYEEACNTGAFMENVQTKQVGRFANHPSTLNFTPDDPNYPCNILDEKHKKNCYTYIGITVVVATQGDFKKAFEQCLKISQDTFQEQCLWGVGNNIPGPHISSKEAGKKCSIAIEISTKAYEQCVLGGMSFLMQLNHGNPQAAVEFCDALTDEYKLLCYQAAGKLLQEWATPNDPLAKKCSAFKESAAQQTCLNYKSSIRTYTNS